MLTAERLTALTAVKDGTASASLKASPGSPMIFEPRTLMVAFGFLLKAGLITTESADGVNGRRPVTVSITERGEDVLSRIAP